MSRLITQPRGDDKSPSATKKTPQAGSGDVSGLMALKVPATLERAATTLYGADIDELTVKYQEYVERNPMPVFPFNGSGL